MRTASLAGLILLASATTQPLLAQDIVPDQLNYVVDRCATIGTEEVQLCVNLAPAPPVIDVLFMMDLTGSMGGELTALQGSIGATIASIRALASTSSVEFGLISHEDYPDTYQFCGYGPRAYSFPGESPYRVDAPIGSSDAAVIAAVQSMILKQGFDAPESYARCLWETAQPGSSINWRPGSLQLVIQFGDQLPHDCDLQQGISWVAPSPTFRFTGVDPGRDAVAGTADDIDWQDDAIAGMQTAGVKLISIFSGPGFMLSPWQEWADATGGEASLLFGNGSVPGGGSLSQYLTGIVASVLSQVDQLEFITDPACLLDITFDPSATLTGPFSVPDTVCVIERITVPQAVADDPTISSLDCFVDVLADGAYIGTQSIHVDLVDVDPPVIQCPASIITGTDPGLCTAIVTYQPTAVDNCAIDRIDCAPTSGSAFPIGTTPVSCTAFDIYGNQSQPCSFDVTVEDTVNPTINCPGAINLPSEAGACGATVTFMVPAADDCSTPTVVCTPASGSFFPVATTPVSCTATDGSGNTAQCGFDVTISDVEAPTVNCPAAIVTGNDPGVCTAVVTYQVSGDDNCAVAQINCAPASGSTFPVGTTAVSCTAVDASGNQSAPCSFDVTVNDTSNPTINCPGPITAPGVAGACGANVNFNVTAADDCSTPTVVCTPASGSFFAVGTTPVSCTATDSSGNTAQCGFDVTVTDASAPTINCPAAVVAPSDPGVCGAAVIFNVTAVDDCSTPTVVCTPASGSFFGVGTTGVSCTATDSSGNTAQCGFDVTVNDASAPNIYCPGAINVANDAGVCGADVAFNVTADDDCSTPTVVCTPASGSFFLVGTTPVSCTATDSSGNTAQCGFDVTVNDLEDPTINCPSSTIVVPTDQGRCDAIVPETLYGVTADDNCALASLLCTPPGGSVFPIGTTQVSCVATDVHGNTAQCSFDVRVEDDEAPTIICPPGSQVLWPPNHRLETIGIVYNDNCDTAAELSYAIQVRSDEHPSLITGAGGRTHCPDAVIGQDGAVQVRVERSGNEDGRIYVIDYLVTDSGGNPTSGTCAIGVPHDQGGQPIPIQGPVLFDATDCTSSPPGGGGGGSGGGGSGGGGGGGGGGGH